MLLFLPPQNADYCSWVVVKSLLSADECEAVVARGRDIAPSAAEVAGADGSRLPHRMRRSILRWLAYSEATAPLFTKIGQAIDQINSKHYRYSLSGLVDRLQLTEYAAGDEYDWHVDHGGGALSLRKLSMTVLLSSREDATGGGFEVFEQRGSDVPLDQGDAVIFPSYVVHRVSPVTAGTRRSLVTWVNGPPFV